MKQTRSVIENHLENHPEFQYHIDTHFVKIAENLESHPDIAIETCKSLIESIAKTIIKKYEWDEFAEESYKDTSFPDLSRIMMKIIKAHSQIQDKFIESLWELMRIFWNHRNKTWDISHWRASPKEKTSSIQDALFIMQLTDNLCQYILWIYFSIESWDQEEIVDYYDEKFKEFNQMLDDDFNQQIEKNNPMKWLFYSRALFEQDLPAYMEKYDEFITL